MERKRRRSAVATTPGTPQVLIVGSGPVGLVLACELLQQGVAVRLINKISEQDASDPHSRAILLVPRALESLRRIGVAERLVAAGREVKTIGYHAEGRLLGTARLDRMDDTPYRFILALPQRETERVLRERLTELGGTIEWGTALQHLDTSGPRPRAVLRHASGGEVATPDWLVGADGASSTVRRLLGSSLHGDATDVTYLIADAPIAGCSADDAQYYYSQHGIVAVIPMRNGLYRIACNVPHDTGASGEPRWQEVLQHAVDQRCGRPLVVGVPTYARLVRPRCGAAAELRFGRCFLAGDAGHVITPAGGQGMNLGIQDAANLGWKLGGVIRGQLPDEVLDSYSRERRAAAVRTAGITARVIGFALQREPWRIVVRNAVFFAADRAGIVQRVLAPMLSQTDVDYGGVAHRPIWRSTQTAHVGQRIPLFVPVAGTHPSEPSLDHELLTVALWPGRRIPGSWSQTCSRLGQLFSDRAHVADLAAASPRVALALRRCLGNAGRIVVVRPDGHIAHLADLEHPDAVLAYLREMTASSGNAPVVDAVVSVAAHSG
jgi:2-polyprenyl-6-methoxyphenol hydroxylase-like FAD-dependent oxidoreductase